MSEDPPARCVLGIDVPGALLSRWRTWLMPERQPYVVPRPLAHSLGLTDDRALLSAETVDSFELYGVGGDQVITLLDRSAARRLPAGVRSGQPCPHRWPTSDVASDLDRVLARVTRGRRPSRHREITPEHAGQIAAVLPGAGGLLGTFPAGSGPNCFGTVMGATGVPEAAGQWMQIDPFERWLSRYARPAPRRLGRGADTSIGTVLVWRDAQGQPAHAAITLGRGLLMEKASQGWMSPVRVLTVREGIMSARCAGLHLTRHLRRAGSAPVPS